ncbi:hypothetical protein [Natronolimnobius baerhuensis]|uniref:Uncharacterized protein n=1 Tax=Natronolimnobius baerhuensis TaxID=253108 RepID=A0A202EDQ5_9EURY|nr:hypothetical protein [Natronolimnobius baerhuensis]OVE86403.1 hypothetical protein B2G88_02290 [Natronolimnobius baerhuensis]
MTELEIPPDATEDRATALVTEHVAVGDVVEVWEADRTDASDPDRTGEVTGLEPGYLELDGKSLGEGSVRYTEIHSLIKLKDE